MSFSILDLYHTLLQQFGHQHWWPMDHSYHKQERTDPREEIIIGAILTQNTAWTNVEKALVNLKRQHALSFQAIRTLSDDDLRRYIQPSGFFNQKAHRLRLIADTLTNLDCFFHQPVPQARTQLLALNGIGPETADSILLYAANLPVFVVDAYTKRLCTRLPLPVNSDSYDDIQRYFQHEIQKEYTNREVPIYQEFHALIVACGKNYCRSTPQHCTDCPLHRGCQQALQLLPQRLSRNVRQANHLRRP